MRKEKSIEGTTPERSWLGSVDMIAEAKNVQIIEGLNDIPDDSPPLTPEEVQAKMEELEQKLQEGFKGGPFAPSLFYDDLTPERTNPPTLD